MTKQTRHALTSIVLLVAAACTAPQPQEPQLALPRGSNPVSGRPLEETEPAVDNGHPEQPPPPDDGCADHVCNGVATEEMKLAVARRAAQTKGCYQNRLRDAPDLSGRLVIVVRVGPTGNVCSSHVVNDAIGDQYLAGCVRNTMQDASYPAPGSGCVDLAVPLSFQPKRPAAGAAGAAPR